MNGLHEKQWVNVITHVHTNASSSDASVLDDRCAAALRRCDGEETAVTWSECFTAVETLEQLLQRGHGEHGPVQMIVVTDHMRRRSHHLPDGHLAAAARTRGLALGAELATRTRDVDGAYRTGPEILAYGGRRTVAGPHGPYHGLSQALLDELYASCLDDEGQELCTRRARDLLRRRGIAHALSHPLDGHALSLEGTLAIVCEFAFIETVNGGFSVKSARMLDAFIRLNNALLSGARLPEEALTSTGRRIVERILERGRIIAPLGGSDAHVRDFDRAVTSMAVPAGRRPEDLRPADFFERLLALAEAPGEALVIRGRAATLSSLIADVSAVVSRNLPEAYRRSRTPITFGKIFATTIYITQDELRQRARQRRRLIRQLRREFDPLRLLQLLQEPGAIQQFSPSLAHGV
jgi:hypothetical protein